MCHIANDDAMKQHRRGMWEEFFRCVTS